MKRKRRKNRGRGFRLTEARQVVQPREALEILDRPQGKSEGPDSAYCAFLSDTIESTSPPPASAAIDVPILPVRKGGDDA